MPDTTTGAVREWRDVILRLQQLTRNDQGVTVINLQIAVNRGDPVWWSIIGQTRVEPASAASQFLACMKGEQK